jgi:hypothetical protein
LIHKTTSNIKKIFPKRVSYQASPTYSLGEFPGVITYRCYNKRLHKLVDFIDIKVDEEIPVRNVSSVDPSTKDIVEYEDEQVQGS